VARSTATLLEQLERFLPPEYEGLRPVLAGMAAAMAEAESAGDDLVDEVTVSGADGIWLQLLAKGYGLSKGYGESDAELRARLQSPEDQLTREAILAVVNDLLSTYTATEASMVEWFEGPAVDVDAWCDLSTIVDPSNRFVLELPLVGDFPHLGAAIDLDAYADVDAWLGTGIEHPIYATIWAAVDRLRAAGVQWCLFVDP